MPEGDTVANVAAGLRKALVGSVLTRTDFRVPALATTDLTGWTVAESASYGKHLLLRLTRDGRPGLTLRSHLRMEGAWRVREPGAALPTPAHLVRVVLTTDTAVVAGMHLHDLALVPTAEEHRLIGHLGPDLLGPNWDLDEALRRLRAKPDRDISSALLDQRNLAGIGNLYRNETLFLRGIWPWAPLADVPDLPAVVTLAQRLLRANVGRWTQATTGSLRKGQELYVFERARRPCRRCRTPIQLKRQSDRLAEDRLTYWCPSCQPA